jgi:hypothetical protein
MSTVFLEGEQEQTLIKWHSEDKLLYEVIQDGRRMWASALQITDADVLECRPLPQTRKDHPSRTGDCSTSSAWNVVERTHVNRKASFVKRLCLIKG